ncbi:hypothetical protein M9434_000875 [Picochlorum sp. BPE23]|nr:hypothetical protein M9434_000875 [Picochlorum sp. BPE23]
MQDARLQNKQIHTGGIAMGKKKLSTNPKVEEARQKKEEAKKKSNAQAKQQQEDAYWAQHANPTAKRDVKREEEMRKKEEARRKKEEARRLAQEEEAELARIGKKKQAPTKVTRREIDQLKANQRNAQEALSQEKEMQRKKTVGVDEYAAHLDVEIDNRKEAVVDARSLDDAVSQLSIGSQEVDRHPEKRAKAMWNAFFEARLPEMKEEKPGLKLQQYKARIFDEWQRSKENPRNQQQQQ